jgi:enamine deaminase RidA (YjgF/YER057c/UK114 family)
MCSGQYGRTPANLPDDIATSYRQDLSDVQSLLAEQLGTADDHLDTQYFLDATAALRGHIELAHLIINLDIASSAR